jgi:hypothetical protein
VASIADVMGNFSAGDAVQRARPAVGRAVTFAKPYAREGMEIGREFGMGLLFGARLLLRGGGHVVHGIVDAIGGLLRLAVTSAATATVATVGAIVAGSLNTMRNSQEILALSQESGLGTFGAARAMNNLAGYGVNASEVDAISRGGFLAQMKSAVWGVGGQPGSPEYLQRYRSRYQDLMSRGEMGRMFARNMESSIGAEGLRGMASLPDAIFNRQMRRSMTLQRTLGMNPQEIERAGQDFKGLIDTVGQAIGLLRDRVISEFLPYLTRGLDIAIGWLEKNSDKVADYIKKGVSWLINELPPLVLRGAAFLVRGFGGIMGAVASLTEGIHRNLPAILGGIDGVLNALRQLAAGAAAAGGFAYKTGSDLTNPQTRSDALSGGIRGLVGGVAVPVIGGAAIGYLIGGPRVALRGAQIGARIARYTAPAGAAYGAYSGVYGEPAPQNAEQLIQQRMRDLSPSGRRFGYGGYGPLGASPDDYTGIIDWIGNTFWPKNSNPPRRHGRDGGARLAAQGQITIADTDTPFAAAAAARQQFLNLVPESNLLATYGGQNSSVSSWLGNAGTWLREREENAYKRADELEGMADNWKQMIQAIEKSTKATERVADNTRDIRDGQMTSRDMMRGMAHLISQLTTYNIMQESLALTRGGGAGPRF